MDINDVIISKGVSTQKVLTDEEKARMDYKEEKPETYEGNEILFDSVFLGEMYVEDKVSQRTGKTYQDSSCKLTFYNDTERVRVSFYEHHFSNYNKDTGNLKCQGDNIICKLMQGLSSDNESNKFMIKYNDLCELVKNIGIIKIRPYSYEDNGGYTKNSFEVLGYQMKQ